MKTCLCCHEDKPTSEFHKNKRRPDGLGAYCKPCAKAKQQISTDARKTRNRETGVTVATKICSICKVEKAASDFCHDICRVDGLTPQCKTGISVAGKSRYHGHRRAKILSDAKQYREQNKEKVRKAKRTAEQKKPEKYAKLRADYTAKNKEKVRQYRHQWGQENKAKVYASIDKRRARKHGNGPVEFIDRNEIYSRDAGICWICQQPVTREQMHLDHKIPLSKGGTHTKANVATARAACNLSKNDKILDTAGARR